MVRTELINHKGIDTLHNPLVERDRGVLLLALLHSGITPIPGAHFILTGSHSVEALTGHQMPCHSDIDANVFYSGRKAPISEVDALIRAVPLTRPRISRTKITHDRLEYGIAHRGSDSLPGMLELRFVEAYSASNGYPPVFTLKGDGGRDFIVPTALASLTGSNGKKFTFLVKSLPYVIASWVIRISGYATNQKREVREDDLRQLNLLLGRTYDKTEVLSAMAHHPQMPTGVDVDVIFDKMTTIVEKGTVSSHTPPSPTPPVRR